MLSGNDEWLDRMPWVPPMPGNKTYVLKEAQKEIERLREEIKRLRAENKELQAGTNTITKRPESARQEKPSEPPREGNVMELGKGDYLYIAGVVKILDHAWVRTSQEASRE